MNANKHFPSPNNVEFHEALEKALKSLKTRKWRYNKKRQAFFQEDEKVPSQRRRMNNINPDLHNFQDTESEDIQEETEELEESQHVEEADENAEMDIFETEDTETENIEDDGYNW